MKKQPVKKVKKAKLSLEERKQAKIKGSHIRSARLTFRSTGFERAPEVAGREVVFEGQRGEFDDVFVHENVILLLEYTISQPSAVTYHLKNKKIIFSKVLNNPKKFIEYLCEVSPEFSRRILDKYHNDDYILRIVYCSRYDYQEDIRAIVNEPNYLDFSTLKYFERISKIIKLSSLNEILDFLEIDPVKVGKGGVLPRKRQTDAYEGSILPEASSGFPTGYKVVSFYVDAATLLSRAYVLRRDGGWRGTFQAYQRMLLPSKIEAIRKKLKSDRQVFVNNVIATLPSDVHPESEGRTLDIAKLTQTAPVCIRLPARANSIGIIDGQHRLFSYYETRDDDEKIKLLRHQQNILVTGIIFPSDLNSEEAERFAARLFLAVNANQTNASSALRQDIQVMLDPFSPTAIGRQIIHKLGNNGPLAGHLERNFYDKGKLKTSSIVSYGLGPLIKLSGDDSIFKLFRHPEKDQIPLGKSQIGLEAYIQFSVSCINQFLNAVKRNVDPARWTTEHKIRGRLLVVTYVNCFLIVLRFLIQNNKNGDFKSLADSMKTIERFDFAAYRSSQYRRMAENIYQTYF